MTEMRGILLYMGTFLAATIVVCAALFEPLRAAFMANQVFNAMIVAVLLLGVVLNVRQVLEVGPALRWLTAFRRPEARLAVETRPRLLAPVQRLLASIHSAGFRLPTLTMRTMLDSIRLRLDESRELSRYMTGLLIFLGLLGTFWGLLDTVGSVSEVIAGISAGDDLAASFAQLKLDLQRPLSGMGTAFSSSLFGLGGALVLGFFDLQAGHAQNRFYNHLEEWLSDLVHLPSAGAGVEVERAAAPGYTDALLEHTADRVHELSHLMARGEQERSTGHERLAELSTRLAELGETLREQQRLLDDLARSQLDLKPVVERLMDSGRGDQLLLEHIRNVDSTLQGLREEARGGREALGEELRSELRLIARVLAPVAPSRESARRSSGEGVDGC
jgi:hypothetical protein